MPNQLSPEQLSKLKRIRFLTKWLDDAFRIPGTRYRIGFDGLLGMFPVVGDALTSFLAAYIIREAAQLGVPPAQVRRMILNVVIDFGLGTVPVAGDLFDVAWKANKKNLAILEAHLKKLEKTLEEPCIDV
jgi:hypothetical protein